jgi:hypothetical protein
MKDSSNNIIFPEIFAPEIYGLPSKDFMQFIVNNGIGVPISERAIQNHIENTMKYWDILNKDYHGS